jgi:hypothetical protein
MCAAFAHGPERLGLPRPRPRRPARRSPSVPRASTPARRDEIRGFEQPRSAFPPMWRLRTVVTMKSERREA